MDGRSPVEEGARPSARAVGGLSSAQMAEDLALLETLSKVPAARTDAQRADAPVDPADQLASWLLHEAGLSS